MIIKAVDMMAEQKAKEQKIACSYECNDAGYKAGYITLYFWKPAVSKAAIIHINKLTFHNKLAQVCLKNIEKHPKHTNCYKRTKKDLQV